MSFLRTILRFLSSPSYYIIHHHHQQQQQQQLVILPRKKVTCTLFGYRRGHVTFAVHLYDPKTTTSDPILLLQLPISTATLVNEMASGLLRISLECHASTASGHDGLMEEPAWRMYCNGRKCSGNAVARRSYTALDSHVLDTVRSVSVGAGVIPPPTTWCGVPLGELLYMRAKFEKVVAGSRHSEAFHMLNPDAAQGSGPELSLFFLRL
ncbi:Protein MIZU-KUSSEI 1 [Linum grandiflorum]